MNIKGRVILAVIAPVLLVGGIAASVRYAWSVITNPQKAWRIALAVDDLGNVAGNGRLGQTISSRAAYAAKAGKTWGKMMCKGLDTLDPGHCTNALTAIDQNLNQGRI